MPPTGVQYETIRVGMIAHTVTLVVAALVEL